MTRARRAFLRTVGHAATALPFHRLLESSAARGAEAESPLRFVGVYVPHGIAAPMLDWTLSPFGDAGLQDRVTVVEGIDLAAGIEVSTNGHSAAAVILTGSAPNNQSTANESLDQFLAVTKGLGARTRITSLVLGVGNRELDVGRNISYGKSGAPISKVIDPAEAFQRVFAAAMPTADPGVQAAADRRRVRDRSILDSVKADIARLQTRLAAPERLKLDQHLTSLRDLEKQVAALPAAAPSRSCTPPATPNRREFPSAEAYNGGMPYLDRIIDLQIEILAQALACDITRFATLFIYYAAGAGAGAGEFLQAEDIHNKVAHQYRASNAASVMRLATQNRYYFAKCAKLLQRLQAGGVLDDTLVYVSSDMGDPNAHSLRGVPTILAGGAHGRIKMGRRLSAPGQSNNKILVSIAQAFGVPIPSYGTARRPEIVNGALPGLA